MENKLAVLERTIPLRAYPKEQLENAFNEYFIDWITDLLGLTGEESAKRLITAIPAIEKHFWSLGFKEITKAFTMYADSELITKPLPNYFTRILVGQIFKEYQQQKTKPKVMIEESKVSDQEKQRVDNEIITKVLQFYIDTGYIDKTRIYAYDILYADNWLPKDAETKKKVYNDAIECLRIELLNKKATSLEEKRSMKFDIESLTKPKQAKAIVKSKELVLLKFFRSLTKDEKKLNEFKLKYK